MDASSVYKLCRHLLHCPQFIYCAIQRCRKSDELCRLSVALKSSPLSDPHIVQISSIVASLFSDTGVGSCLEEFQDLMYAPDPTLGGKWGSKLYFGSCPRVSMAGTYLLNLFNAALGTEVSLSTSEIVDDLLAEITRFLQKTLILKIPKVAIELMVDCGDLPHSCSGNVILANDCSSFSPASNIEHLKSGLEDYIFKHGNSLDNICRSCFSTGPIKLMHKLLLAFNHFLYRPLKCFWEAFSLSSYFVMLPPAKQKAGLGRSLVKKAIKLALNDLKEKNAGVLLSAHALKTCSYAPDLAKTISGLILSSNDSNFQGECISLLGLQGQNFEKKTVENYVKERIISVIELNDRKPQRSREAAPSLFEDGYFQEPGFLYVDFEEGEEAIDFLE
ncbi:hypothetical protein RJ639_006959 [Escallonia herrerae]|uniref:Uncharacterized protein n=1 Tax=Escallonia herrerae TaxID=1293975 RepID=A0AA88VZJ3_9ASTE|nr:hypothetical protein RJ639_006959 [Escallonia herrerae]